MKRYILPLIIAIALIFAASEKMNAQIITYGGDINNDGKYNITDMARLIDVLKGNKTYASNATDVNLDDKTNMDDVSKLREFTLADIVPGSIGKAKRTNGTYVEWVQLWADGPKWAVYNVGAESVSEYGGYYNWGTSETQNSSNKDDYCQSTTDIQGGNYDTAKKLWGEYWQMPTKDDLDKLVSSDYTESEWTTDYNGTGKAGRVFKGIGQYASNSIFFPAAGYCSEAHDPSYTGNRDYLWSSTPNGSGEAYDMCITAYGAKEVRSDARNYGFSVRAIVCKTKEFIVYPGEEANEEVGAGAKKRM